MFKGNFLSEKTEKLKYLIVTKKQIITVLAVTLTVLVSLTGINAFASDSKKLPIYCVECEKKRIAISFDAAWGNESTKTLLDILKKYDVPATFFVVGTWVDKYPESVREIASSGNEVQNHSNTHPYLTELSKEQMADEINSCNNKIKEITGIMPTLLRPPYGDYDSLVVKTTEECKMKAVQWSVDSLDWKENATVESIVNRVVSKTQNGSIILMHNGAKYTPEALPKILETLKKDGYEFVLISDLIYKDNYEIKHDGTQCKKDG